MRRLNLRTQAGAGSAFVSDTREHPMTRSPQHPNDPDTEQHRARITLAVITGILAGASRALSGWLLDHLTTGS